VTDPAVYRQQIDEWHAKREARLKADDGWLTLVGLFWLNDGKNLVGSSKEANIKLPASAPAKLATIDLANGKVTYSPVSGTSATIDDKPAVKMELKSDEGAGEPNVVKSGSVSFYVIKRGPKLGVRVKDTENAARRSFTGVDRYPVDPKWRVEAKLEPYSPMKQIPIVNILGMVEPTPSPGALVFQLDGKPYRIDPILEEGTDELFILVKDKTSGPETYGAGRYVYAPKPGADGKTVIDFNKLYNPPCAFTPFATCPLPPPQNRLPFRIEAGEKRYAGHH
jgi:uncharacterized protein (DUF1684 family)